MSSNAAPWYHPAHACEARRFTIPDKSNSKELAVFLRASLGMTHIARVQRAVTCASAVTAAAAVLTLPPPAAAQTASPAVTGAPVVQGATGNALDEFQRRLNGYLALRAALARKLQPLAATASAAELSARQEALAAAMREARKGAKQGDLIPALVARQIADTALADFRRRNPMTKAAALREVPDTPRPVINKTYPVDAALPTVPPLLLASLPKLPDNLQYRFFGRHIAILDGDVQIIVDFVPNALPPH